LTEKKESNDKDGGVVFCSSAVDNASSISISGGNSFNNFDWRYYNDDFSPTFNVPDMDISAGALRR